MRINVRLTKIAVSVALMTTASTVLAEDVRIEHIEVKGEKLNYKVQTTTTATKTNTLLRISVYYCLTEQQIADQSMQSMADVVRYVPGVQMSQGEGHRDAPIFRGNISTADFFVNGVRDDVQICVICTTQNVLKAVPKGPSGMIFGMWWCWGLINRVSKQANWLATGGLDLSYSAQQQGRLAADYNHAVNEDLAVRLTGVYEDSDSFRDYFYAKRSGLKPTLTYKLTEQQA